MEEVARRPAHLPQPLVRLAPVGADRVRQAAHELPVRRGDPPADLRVEPDRLEHLAVDVELPLLHRAVADPHRARAPVAGEVGELDLGEHPLAADPVEDLEVLGPPRARAPEPVAERVRLVAEAEREQGDEGERAVADPGVAVVPVPLAARLLGERGGRRGDDRPRGRVGERLEHERRAPHRRLVGAVVAAAGDPPAPEARSSPRACARAARARAPGPGRRSSSEEDQAASTHTSSPAESCQRARTAPGTTNSGRVPVTQSASAPPTTSAVRGEVRRIRGVNPPYSKRGATVTRAVTSPSTQRSRRSRAWRACTVPVGVTRTGMQSVSSSTPVGAAAG